MYNFTEDAIREAAYYIWKNNGCPANSSVKDWDAAISQLTSQSAVNLKAPKKTYSVRVLMPTVSSKRAYPIRNVASIILRPVSSAKTR